MVSCRVPGADSGNFSPFMKTLRFSLVSCLLGALALSASAADEAREVAAPSATATATEAEPPASLLPPLEVKDNALCSFGISVQAVGNPKTKSITRLFITDVWEKSEAEKLGLKAGDEILTINGVKVSEMKGGMQRGSDLFELLVNRGHGSRIKLEVEVRVVKRVTLTAG